MLRKQAVALALSLLMPTVASALGLGALKASSALNQPFDGRIEILGATAADFDTLSIKLADAAQFDRAGVLREAVLLSLKFEIVETPAGNDYIRVSTRDPVREPFLNFLLEMNWANGRMVREYTVLLDPPLYDPNRRGPSAAAPAAVPLPRSTGVAPAPSTAPAMRTPARSYQGDGSIGPVQSADTAWGLALRHRPDAGVSVQRMMIALLRANPEAFTNSNVNLLRRGAVLRMPSRADIDALSQSEAVAEVARQHQLWEEYRQGATAKVTTQPMGTPEEAPTAESAPAAAQPKPADDARLELVAPESDSGEKSAAAAGTTATDAALAAEEATSKGQENADLQAKLDEASGIIDLLQRQVEIKDDELAKLQARLAELGVEHGDAGSAATTPAPPTADAGTETPAEPAAGAETPAPPSPPTVAETPPTEPATAEPEPAPPAAPPATSTEKPTKTVEAPTPVPPVAATPPASFIDQLIPEHVRNAVPGGAVTILGVVGSILLLGLAALGKSLSARRGKAITASSPQPAARAIPAGVAASTALAETPVAVDAAVEVEEEEVADQFTRTLEATADQLAGDPLEEVNVYLAYERFDQAEELVKKVIEQYPGEHKYKLRLLEIYYSANNKQAYEANAQSLLDAVGEHHPLWESAVAMWSEMSPTRALFAPGGDSEPAPAASKEFVDITGDATAPGGGTMSMGPGGDGPLESTLVGLTNEATGESSVDFDLSAAAADSELDGIVDLTTGEMEDSDGVIDLTATVEQLEKSGFLDLTSPDEQQGETYSDVFDISADLPADEGDTADLGLAVSAPPAAPGSELLDITKTGNVTFDGAEPLLAVTAGALADTASGSGLNPKTASTADGFNLDFDISDTVAPRLDTEAGPTDTETDITTKLPPEETLDFDIEGLGLDLTGAADTADVDDDSFDLTADGSDFELNLAAEAGADLDLSLQNPALDLQIAEAPGISPSSDDEESELEFDLALQDTTDFDKLDVDDTLELPKSSSTRPGSEPLAESLEDLTRSMEASLAGLDLDEEPADDGVLDLEFGGLDGESVDLDFSIDDADDGMNTLALDADDMTLERTGINIDRTVVMPRDANVEYQSEADEVDTKLNLAKAYIELGDSDGARSILEEVLREGTDGQRQEAQQLVSQLA